MLSEDFLLSVWIPFVSCLMEWTEKYVLILPTTQVIPFPPPLIFMGRLVVEKSTVPLSYQAIEN